ncbi:SDR family oxidoreductase [Sporosarcina sp. ACRSL]|uniref:SDR family oxidoreductase n=1 Tax=Sporosarcina sp. ACRSL TaxID=2918215 RepID=UPI001EF4BECF|nr:SDR family oxidoreductase [Sporosarcina sp. ACRSL]MCG7344126.1 SDR family oxidoreductase [Sporosarcina sp. ACRSL]
MKVLILGGTRFLGRALVEEALKREHEVTLFNRGTNPEVFPEVEQLTGDRNGDVSQLENRKWDVVIDTCGISPHQIEKIAAVLGANIEHYTYISSISVYPDWIPLNIAEDYHVHSIPPENVLKDIEEGTVSPYEYYGGMKVACEEEAEKHWPERVLQVRAGLLVGSYDYTDRLPYWVHRVAQGGTVLVPGRPDRAVQFIDVKDLAAWVLTMAENRKAGTYNTTGPGTTLTMAEFLNTCKAVTDSDAKFVWADEQFMLEQKVQPWTEMPLWIPEQFALQGASEPWKGSSFISIEKAVRNGLSFRPLEDTISDIYQCVKAKETEWKAGISREREQELLEAWLQKAE